MGKRKSWLISEEDDGNRHVSPILDRREHDMSATCWCAPRIEQARIYETLNEPPKGRKRLRNIIIHQSADRREEHETH